MTVNIPGRKPLVPLRITEESPGFVRIPHFWTDELFGIGTIPASFWKFMATLWRGITNGNRQYQTMMGLSQFEITNDQASKWKAAVSVSGLFTVTTGKWFPRTSSLYVYRQDATVAEWVIFVKALNEKIECDKVSGVDPRQAVAFGIELAVLVDQRRVEAGFPERNTEYLSECRDAGLLVNEEHGSYAARTKTNYKAKNKFKGGIHGT